jgi:uncharacterized protein
VSKTTCAWHPKKAASNLRDHGVSFEEAATVFDDELVRFKGDTHHGENRLVAIGVSARNRALFVVSIELDGDVMHIISARRATKHERRKYEEG